MHCSLRLLKAPGDEKVKSEGDRESQARCCCSRLLACGPAKVGYSGLAQLPPALQGLYFAFGLATVHPAHFSLPHTATRLSPLLTGDDTTVRSALPPQSAFLSHLPDPLSSQDSVLPP